jgi:hypothetical protein
VLEETFPHITSNYQGIEKTSEEVKMRVLKSVSNCEKLKKCRHLIGNEGKTDRDETYACTPVKALTPNGISGNLKKINEALS